VINCNLNSISRRFPDIVLWNVKPPRVVWAPIKRMSFKFRLETYHTKSWNISLHSTDNGVILASAILSQYTRVTDRQTTVELCYAKLQRSAKNGKKMSHVRQWTWAVSAVSVSLLDTLMIIDSQLVPVWLPRGRLSVRPSVS